MTTTLQPAWVPPGPGEDPELDAAVVQARTERDARLDAELEGAKIGSALATILRAMPPAARKAFEEATSHDPEPIGADEVLADLTAQRESVYGPAWAECLPDLYAGLTVDRLKPQQCPDELLAWADDERQRNLILHGPSRHGKTGAAFTIGSYLRAKGRYCLGWSAPDLAAMSRPGGDARSAEMAEECDVLIIDDLGREKVSEFWLERLYVLLDRRATERNRPLGGPVLQRRTVITTNLVQTEIVERYGDPVLGRLREMSTVVKIQGEPLGKEIDW